MLFMPNKSSLELPIVQKKVIEELDVLTDAFVSTFNEIGKMIKAFSEEVSALIEEFKEENNWKLNDKKFSIYLTCLFWAIIVTINFFL